MTTRTMRTITLVVRNNEYSFLQENFGIYGLLSEIKNDKPEE